MELTKEQIQRVEHYLNVKNIKYIDVRFEVLDHIVSDIETTIEKNNLDFETAFYKVTDKWNAHLKETSSWYFGIAHSAPKIVMDKAKNYYRKWFLTTGIILTFLAFVESKLSFPISKDSQLYSTNTLITINVLCIIIFAFLRISNSKIKEKTTFSFILKTQSLGIILGCIAIVFSGITEGITPIYNLTLLFLSTTFIYFYFLKKHKKAIKKYKIV